MVDLFFPHALDFLEGDPSLLLTIKKILSVCRKIAPKSNKEEKYIGPVLTGLYYVRHHSLKF